MTGCDQKGIFQLFLGKKLQLFFEDSSHSQQQEENLKMFLSNILIAFSWLLNIVSVILLLTVVIFLWTFNCDHCTVVLFYLTGCAFSPSVLHLAVQYPGLYYFISAKNSIFLGNPNLIYFMLLFLRTFWSFLGPFISVLLISAFLKLTCILSSISSR